MWKCLSILAVLLAISAPGVGAQRSSDSPLALAEEYGLGTGSWWTSQGNQGEQRGVRATNSPVLWEVMSRSLSGEGIDGWEVRGYLSIDSENDLVLDGVLDGLLPKSVRTVVEGSFTDISGQESVRVSALVLGSVGRRSVTQIVPIAATNSSQVFRDLTDNFVAGLTGEHASSSAAIPPHHVRNDCDDPLCLRRCDFLYERDVSRCQSTFNNCAATATALLLSCLSACPVCEAPCASLYAFRSAQCLYNKAICLGTADGDWIECFGNCQ